MASIILATILMSAISSTSAYDFYVGGKDGWVQNPREGYNDWASRMRFQVNDRLVFKYKKEEDSVLVVKDQEDYDSCNVKKPTQKLEGGDSIFQFGRSGPFFFISGVPDKCSEGEKMIVVVMATRNKNTPPVSPSPSPSPLSSPT
ncbi:early nodulin-like protein 1, partial [Asparagus officinalis]|uniref:early nodulin-like protein 1 n=1 Tax=Asparagus officinalis TaxID=4686 RepID=UPI00098E5FEC